MNNNRIYCFPRFNNLIKRCKQNNNRIYWRISFLYFLWILHFAIDKIMNLWKMILLLMGWNFGMKTTVMFDYPQLLSFLHIILRRINFCGWTEMKTKYPKFTLNDKNIFLKCGTYWKIVNAYFWIKFHRFVASVTGQHFSVIWYGNNTNITTNSAAIYFWIIWFHFK